MEIKEIEAEMGMSADQIDQWLKQQASEVLKESPTITDLAELLALLSPDSQMHALRAINDANALSNHRLALIFMKEFGFLFYLKNSTKQIDQMTRYLEEQLSKVSKRVLIDFHNTMVGQAADVRRQTLEEFTGILDQVMEIKEGIDDKLDRLVGQSARVENAVEDIEKLRDDLKQVMKSGVDEIRKEIKKGPGEIRAAATAAYQNDIMRKEVDIQNKIQNAVVDAGKKGIKQMIDMWDADRKISNRFWSFVYSLAGTGTALLIYSFFK